MTILSPHDPSRLRQISGQISDGEAKEKEGAIIARLESVGRKVVTSFGEIVILDFFVGFAMLFVVYPVTGGLPGGVLLGAAMAFIGFCRRATLQVRWGGVMLLLALILLAFLVVESQHNHMPWTQRIVKFFILFLAASAIATGRFNVRSLIIGVVLAALVNVPLFYAGITSNNYPPYLTGYWGDKNVAGMYYGVIGILGLIVIPKRTQIIWVVGTLGLLFLTGSRTSLAAFILALAWVLVRNRLGLMVRWGVAIIGWFILNFFETNFASNSAFGDRVGDDWYRHQVEAAMTAKTHVTPWFGLGLNQGFVMLGGVRREWFHNSYQQAFVEGGYPFLVFTVVVFVLLGVGLFDRRAVIGRDLLRAEASIIVVMVCAWKLGEVFMTLGAFFVLGIVIAYRLGVPIKDSDLAWVLDERPKKNQSAWDSILADQSRSAIDPIPNSTQEARI